MKRNKHKEIVFSCLSLVAAGSLFGSFAGNLQGFEVFSQGKNQVFIIGEGEKIPYGFNAKKAKLIAYSYQPQTLQKLLLLGVTIISSGTALLIANIDFDQIEIDYEVGKIESTAKKQIATESIKNKYALMSLSQREQFRLEIESLLELTGGDTTLQATEINATDRFINCSYMLSEGHDLDKAVAATWGLAPGTDEHSAKKVEFEQWLKGE
ncbi:MAG: hypothetical protein ACOVQ3_03455 [Dolichospermum sp.]|jgi:hypothetical protein